LIEQTELPDDDPDFGAVVAALAIARAGALGRAPVPEDIEVALALSGHGFEAPDEVTERRERWMASVPHEVRPGQTAVEEVDRDLLVKKPDEVRRMLGGPTSTGH
jgi:hypothetical protein